MSVPDPLSAAAKEGPTWLTALRDLPLWLLAGIALSIAVFVSLFHTALSEYVRVGLTGAAILFATLTVFRAIALAPKVWRERQDRKAARKTFHPSAVEDSSSWWYLAKQPNGSFVTQISAHVLVKNVSTRNVGLVGVKLVRPRLRGEVITSQIMLRALDENIFGSTAHSGHYIPPGMALMASIHMMIRKPLDMDPALPLSATFEIVDDEGNAERVSATLRGHPPKPGVDPAVAAREQPHTITDPIEKELVSVLHSELNRYDKCGRSVGGLGSIHLVYRGRRMNGVGGDSWTPDSPDLQSIAKDTNQAQLVSDNLEAVMTLYATIQDAEGREGFRQMLLSRLNNDKGYLAISYFIVAALWRLGHLAEALQTAKETLPQDERKVFGLSNVLMLLNGLLRYRHDEFTPSMIDDIERFIYGMAEHTFYISEKIADIRASRVRQIANK